ncbi:MAG: RNA methyltransferase [Vicinamibacterales bacterium]|jgi:TrmH family RNA methyltransferase|nr:RNA methyltransferase [Acidobacteriota bacterium]MDP7472940.1 RNA methyltransferase [Vicinamibacterales bacterium]MDP7672139.1 RNA methyltransferase [Vicinamibacterales bacterium]HJO37362.1 RNA methyltransferase [Vicinamibacterales bacterium]
MPADFEQMSSRRNATVGAFRAAAASRAADAPMLLDGWHLVEDARRAHLALTLVAVASSRLEADASLAALTSAIARQGARVLSVTDGVMDAISPVSSPSGIVALAERPAITLDDVLARPPRLVIGLVDLQDPGNVGGVIRTADAAGASGVVAAGQCADPYGWKALRGAMGGTFRVPVARASDPAAVVTHARAAGLTIVATAAGDGAPPWTMNLTQPTLVLIGGEGGGLPTAVVAAADETLSIPMPGGAESLNAAAAAAVVIYESVRQRRGDDTPAAPWPVR